MEDLSYHYSPKARDFMSTQTTNMTSSRMNSDCNLCPRTAPYQKEDLTATDLKREYSKALNCIEILKLEKKNLQDALVITKDFKKDKTGKFFVSSTRCTTAAASPKGDFRSVKSVDVERKVIELEHELVEQRRLLDRSNANNELLKRENYNYRERLQEVEDLQLQNHHLRTDVKELTDELRRESRRNYELEDEKDQLLDRRNQVANSARKLPPRELYKYLDHVYELIGSLNRNHYAHYHFRECFIDEENIEGLIEDKETNELLLQSFRYITNLLVNISSNNASLSADQRRASRTLLTESESDNQRRDGVVPYHLGSPANEQYTTDDEMHAPNPTPNTHNISKNLNLNAVSRDIDAQPHSFGDANPLSQQDLSPEHHSQNGYTKVYSPSHSRNIISSSYSHKPNTDINSTVRDLSRSPSYKSGISMASPNNRRDKSPTSKHVTEGNATANVSKQSIGRSHVSQRPMTPANQETNLNVSKHSAVNRTHVSQRPMTPVNQTAAEANALNMSKQSLGRSHVSQRPMTPANQAATEANLNASKHSVNKTHVSQRPMTPANQTVIENNTMNVSRHTQGQGKSFVSRTKTDANLNVSKHSQARSHVSHRTGHQTTHQNFVEEDYYEDRTGNQRSMTPELEDKEMRLRELDRELKEKDRLLQMKEKELKDRSVMEKSMSRYNNNRAQEETEVNRSRLSQSRKLASQKSLLKDPKSALQSKQRIDDSRVLKSQTQLKDQSHVEYERANTNLNKSNLNVQSRIIPSMTSLNEIDASPKGFMASPKHTQTQIKSLTKVANSVQSIDPHSEYQRSPKTFTAQNSQKFLNAASAYDVHDVSASRGGQRIPYQEAYMSAQSFDNSPQSKFLPKPQTLDRLDNSGIKLIDQRGREDFENSQVYDGTPMAHLDIGSPKSENTRRRITFDVRNMGDIEEVESSPRAESLSRKMSAAERSSGKKGTEYASFRVSFGRTQSKYMRDQSPDVETKDSLYIIDCARRKRVTHHEQTYDVVQGNEVRYDLQSMGSDYSVSKSKPRSRYESSVERSQQLASPQATCRVEKENK